MAVLQGCGQNLPSPCVCYPKDPIKDRVNDKRKQKVSKTPLVKDRPDNNSLTDNCKISQTVIFIKKLVVKERPMFVLA